MSHRRVVPRISTFLCIAAASMACGDASAPCPPSERPALVISAYDGGLNNPVHDVTIIYDRHGDDSLTVLRDLPTAVNVRLGNRPGIYDLRLMAPGFADYLWTNVTISAEGCDPRGIESQVFMQRLP